MCLVLLMSDVTGLSEILNEVSGGTALSKAQARPLACLKACIGSPSKGGFLDLLLILTACHCQVQVRWLHAR